MFDPMTIGMSKVTFINVKIICGTKFPHNIPFNPLIFLLLFVSFILFYINFFTYKVLKVKNALQKTPNS